MSNCTNRRCFRVWHPVDLTAMRSMLSDFTNTKWFYDKRSIYTLRLKKVRVLWLFGYGLGHPSGMQEASPGLYFTCALNWKSLSKWLAKWCHFRKGKSETTRNNTGRDVGHGGGGSQDVRTDSPSPHWTWEHVEGERAQVGLCEQASCSTVFFFSGDFVLKAEGWTVPSREACKNRIRMGFIFPPKLFLCFCWITDVPYFTLPLTNLLLEWLIWKREKEKILCKLVKQQIWRSFAVHNIYEVTHTLTELTFFRVVAPGCNSNWWNDKFKELGFDESKQHFLPSNCTIWNTSMLFSWYHVWSHQLMPKFMLQNLETPALLLHRWNERQTSMSLFSGAVEIGFEPVEKLEKKSASSQYLCPRWIVQEICRQSAPIMHGNDFRNSHSRCNSLINVKFLSSQVSYLTGWECACSSQTRDKLLRAALDLNTAVKQSYLPRDLPASLTIICWTVFFSIF